MNPSSPHRASSWLRDVIENSAAVVEVMTPEIQHGLRVVREVISSHAEGIGRRRARERAASAEQ